MDDTVAWLLWEWKRRGTAGRDRKKSCGNVALFDFVVHLKQQPGTERIQALADISHSALCCHSNKICAPTANPPNSAQAQPEAPLPFPPSYIRVRAVVWECGEGPTDRQSHTHTHTHKRLWPIYISPWLCLTWNVKSEFLSNFICVHKYRCTLLSVNQLHNFCYSRVESIMSTDSCTSGVGTRMWEQTSVSVPVSRFEDSSTFSTGKQWLFRDPKNFIKQRLAQGPKNSAYFTLAARYCSIMTSQSEISRRSNAKLHMQ